MLWCQNSKSVLDKNEEEQQEDYGLLVSKAKINLVIIVCALIRLFFFILFDVYDSAVRHFHLLFD